MANVNVKLMEECGLSLDTRSIGLYVHNVIRYGNPFEKSVRGRSLQKALQQLTDMELFPQEDVLPQTLRLLNRCHNESERNVQVVTTTFIDKKVVNRLFPHCDTSDDGWLKNTPVENYSIKRDNNTCRIMKCHKLRSTRIFNKPNYRIFRICKRNLDHITENVGPMFLSRTEAHQYLRNMDTNDEYYNYFVRLNDYNAKVADYRYDLNSLLALMTHAKEDTFLRWRRAVELLDEYVENIKKGEIKIVNLREIMKKKTPVDVIGNYTFDKPVIEMPTLYSANILATALISRAKPTKLDNGLAELVLEKYVDIECNRHFHLTDDTCNDLLTSPNMKLSTFSNVFSDNTKSLVEYMSNILIIKKIRQHLSRSEFVKLKHMLHDLKRHNRHNRTASISYGDLRTSYLDALEELGIDVMAKNLDIVIPNPYSPDTGLHLMCELMHEISCRVPMDAEIERFIACLQYLSKYNRTKNVIFVRDIPIFYNISEEFSIDYNDMTARLSLNNNDSSIATYTYECGFEVNMIGRHIVPSYVLNNSDREMFLAHIQNERNIELRRILIEMYGWKEYLEDSGYKSLSRDSWGELYIINWSQRYLPEYVCIVENSTPNVDGSISKYALKCGSGPFSSALEAIAHTFGLTAEEYANDMEAMS